MSSNPDDPTQKLLLACVSATKSINALPSTASGDFQFYHTGFDEFRTRTSALSAQLLRNMRQVVSYAVGEPRRFGDNDERMHVLSNAVDVILESVDMALDEATGSAPSKLPVASSGAAAASTPSTSKSSSSNVQMVVTQSPASSKKQSGSFSLMQARNIRRPQLEFRDRIDNSRLSPFIPRIFAKPNATEPLADVFRLQHEANEAGATAEGDTNAETSTQHAIPLQSSTMSPALRAHLESTLGLAADTPSVLMSIPHPYEAELRAFTAPDSVLSPVQETLYTPLAHAVCTFVDTLEALVDCVRQIELAHEIAVDLENHSYRSFQGFVCLMQLSTRTADFLVDTIALREHMHLLQPVFTSPTITKVLHGCDSDIVWLQRDFGLYLVNVFDTGQATRVLAFPSYSLAHLLAHYCGVNADKKYQLADWRVRPLPTEMARYAQEDTHYLLYVYDRLRNELCARSSSSVGFNLLEEVWRRSTELCLKRYEKEPYDAALCEKGIPAPMHARREQMLALHALWDWRDATARDEDESLHYVLPRHMLVRIAETMPSSVVSLLACCTPTPPLVRLNVMTLMALIGDARRAAATAHDVLAETTATTATSTTTTANSAVAVAAAAAKLSDGHTTTTVPSRIVPTRFTNVPSVLTVEEARLAQPNSGLATAFGGAGAGKKEKENQREGEEAQRVKALVAQVFASFPVRLFEPLAAERIVVGDAQHNKEVPPMESVVVVQEDDTKEKKEKKHEEEVEEVGSADVGVEMETEEGVGSGSGSGKRRRREKRMLAKAKGLTQPIAAFDYAQASSSFFAGSGGGSGAAGKGSKDGKDKKRTAATAFSQLAEGIEEPKLKKAPRLSTQPRSGTKSSTFVQKKTK